MSLIATNLLQNFIWLAVFICYCQSLKYKYIYFWIRQDMQFTKHCHYKSYIYFIRIYYDTISEHQIKRRC
jgi:hypothetical protein